MNGEETERWLDSQLTGFWANGNLETDLRMAVATIQSMSHKIPKDYAVQPLIRYIEKRELERALQEIDIARETWHDTNDKVFARKMNNRKAKITKELEKFNHG